MLKNFHQQFAQEQSSTDIKSLEFAKQVLDLGDNVEEETRNKLMLSLCNLMKVEFLGPEEPDSTEMVQCFQDLADKSDKIPEQFLPLFDVLYSGDAIEQDSTDTMQQQRAKRRIKLSSSFWPKREASVKAAQVLQKLVALKNDPSTPVLISTPITTPDPSSPPAPAPTPAQNITSMADRLKNFQTACEVGGDKISRKHFQIATFDNENVCASIGNQNPFVDVQCGDKTIKICQRKYNQTDSEYKKNSLLFF